MNQQNTPLPDGYINVIAADVEETRLGLRLSGDIVFATVSSLIDAGTRLLEKKQAAGQISSKLVVDCSGIKRIDGAGLAMLIEWKRWGIKHKINIEFSTLPKQVKSLIKATRLEPVLRVN